MNKIISVSEATGGWIVRVVSPTGAVVPLYCDGSFKKAIREAAAAKICEGRRRS